ncbi:ERBB-3 BINDING PROTEIN 1, partial [Nymphaea thermarum]
NKDVTEAIQKVAAAYDCKIVEGVLGHQLKQFAIDGNKLVHLVKAGRQAGPGMGRVWCIWLGLGVGPGPVLGRIGPARLPGSLRPSPFPPSRLPPSSRLSFPLPISIPLPLPSSPFPSPSPFPVPPSPLLKDLWDGDCSLHDLPIPIIPILGTLLGLLPLLLPSMDALCNPRFSTVCSK